MVGSLLYSLVRFWLDVIATSHGDQAKLQAEVLALRHQVHVLERRSSGCAGVQAIAWFWQPGASGFRHRRGRVYW